MAPRSSDLDRLMMAPIDMTMRSLHAEGCGRPTSSSARGNAKAVEATKAKSKAGGWQAHPATGDHDYSEEEWEFVQAVKDYQQRSGRKFPTFTEILKVAKDIGYHK